MLKCTTEIVSNTFSLVTNNTRWRDMQFTKEYQRNGEGGIIAGKLDKVEKGK
jgi:hypothetical protein